MTEAIKLTKEEAQLVLSRLREVVPKCYLTNPDQLKFMTRWAGILGGDKGWENYIYTMVDAVAAAGLDPHDDNYEDLYEDMALF